MYLHHIQIPNRRQHYLNIKNENSSTLIILTIEINSHWLVNKQSLRIFCTENQNSVRQCRVGRQSHGWSRGHGHLHG